MCRRGSVYPGCQKALLLLAFLAIPLSAAEEPAVAATVEFIENGKVKIGVDLGSGGSVFWFSKLPDGPNLLNHADRGRFIQQSYYGAPDGSKWGDKDWRWNPVQGGHYQGKPAKLLEQKKSEAGLLREEHSRELGRRAALGRVPHGRMDHAEG